MSRTRIAVSTTLIVGLIVAFNSFGQTDSTTHEPETPHESPAPETAAQQPATETAPTEPAAQPPAAEQPPAADQPTAEQVLNELLRRRQENPLIEPARPVADPTPMESRPAAAPLGTAPSADRAKLRREGQFMVRRRGHMVRATGGATPWMFTFDADADGMQDPPMFLMPCQMLEDMEQIVADRGADTPFDISGQIFVYRNANYLLPTMVKESPQRGNLQP